MLLVSHLYLKIDTKLRGPMIPIIDPYSRMVRYLGTLIRTPWFPVLRNTAPPEQLQTVVTMFAQRAQYRPNHTSPPYLKILIMPDLLWTDTDWFCSTSWLIAYDSLWVQYFLCATYIHFVHAIDPHLTPLLFIQASASSKTWAVSWRLFCTHGDKVFVGVKTVNYYYFRAS